MKTLKSPLRDLIPALLTSSFVDWRRPHTPPRGRPR